ncbi:Na+/H+ antiporter subunit E [Sphaerotilaceae bacterium SBD11-9]
MKRLLPSPWLSFGLFCGWLLLTRSVSLGQVLLGLLAALALPALMAPLRPAPGSLHQGAKLAALILRVGGDVVRSAIEVAIGVFRAGRKPPRSAFVIVPLDLRDLNGLAALAMITTVIPGTVWCELAPDRSALLLHVFDLGDEAAFIAQFKADYEQPLKDIFG